MILQHISEKIRKHQGDTAWLEEHGRAVLAEYVALHDKQDQYYANEAFIKVMFKDPKTGGLFAKAPRWWLEEQEQGFEKFKRDLAKIHPAFKNAWGGPKKVKRDGEGAKAVTVIETRRGKR
ncbi:MAG: hypothetical protein RBU45_25380 [Myxococcota bacterium]|jgi:hypothetical protein|nr:hypothetical protein [Myxococcota bacterium]